MRWAGALNPGPIDLRKGMGFHIGLAAPDDGPGRARTRAPGRGWLVLFRRRDAVPRVRENQVGQPGCPEGGRALGFGCEGYGGSRGKFWTGRVLRAII